MADEQPQAPAPPGMPQPTMMQIECIQCHQPIVVIQPIFRFFNAPELSAIMCSHTKVFKCGNCGAAFIPLINGLDNEGRILLAWTRVDTKDHAPSIAPGTDQNLKSAIVANQIGNKVKLN